MAPPPSTSSKVIPPAASTTTLLFSSLAKVEGALLLPTPSSPTIGWLVYVTETAVSVVYGSAGGTLVMVASAEVLVVVAEVAEELVVMAVSTPVLFCRHEIRLLLFFCKLKNNTILHWFKNSVTVYLINDTDPGISKLRGWLWQLNLDKLVERGRLIR